MKRCLIVIGMSLGMLLTAGLSTAEAGKGAKKNAEHWVTGRVVAVHHHQKGMTITVQTHHHRKHGTTAGQAPASHHSHRKFHVHGATAVEFVHHGHRAPSSASAILRGSHVGVLAHGEQADRVEIFGRHHHIGATQRFTFVPRSNIGHSHNAKMAMRKKG